MIKSQKPVHSETIQVVLRFRPPNAQENIEADPSIWEISDKNCYIQNEYYAYFEKLKTRYKDSQIKYVFDNVFNKEQDTFTLYSKYIKRIVLQTLNGINGTIFAYGQTGAGKTYTIMGNDIQNSTEKKMRKSVEVQKLEPQPGSLTYSISEIYEACNNDLSRTFEIQCSYIEIYNDVMYDLFSDQQKENQKLVLHEQKGTLEFTLQGANEPYVDDKEQILKLIFQAESQKHTGKTFQNEVSSRAHNIFKIRIKSMQQYLGYSNERIKQYRMDHQDKQNVNLPNLQEFIKDDGKDPTLCTESHLNFVDLSGNEKITEINNEFEKSKQNKNQSAGSFNTKDKNYNPEQENSQIKERQKETGHINKSLFFLTQVINKRSEGEKSGHIPYRNSVLTKLLRIALGGNSTTLIILCASPTLKNVDTTLKSIQFGQCAKKIENQVFILNQVIHKCLIKFRGQQRLEISNGV